MLTATFAAHVQQSRRRIAAHLPGQHDQGSHGHGGGSDDDDDDYEGPGLDDDDDGSSEFDLDEAGAPRFSDAYREKYGSVLNEDKLGDSNMVWVEPEKGNLHIADDSRGTMEREVVQELTASEAGELGDGVYAVYSGEKESFVSKSGVKVEPAGADPTQDGVHITFSGGQRLSLAGEAGDDAAFEFQEALLIAGDTGSASNSGGFYQRMIRARARAQATERLLARIANHPGHADQKSHGRRGAKSGGLTGQAALDAVPATLTPAPKAHLGHHEGATLAGPSGIGSADALSEYEGAEYQVTNETLRGAYRRDDPPSEHQIERETTVAARVADIDQTMAVSRLTDDVVVERGITNGARVFGDSWHAGVINEGTEDLEEQDAEYERWLAGDRPDLTGLRWTEKAYVSTSADPGVADDFVERRVRFQREGGSVGHEGEPVVMRISVPQGTGAVQMSPMGEMGPRGKKTSAAEILFERGLSMHVTADHGVDDDGIRRLDVEVIPGG